MPQPPTAPTPRSDWREAAPLLRGQGRFCGDVKLADALVLHLLRSPVAMARITALDIGAALAAPGVHAVHGGADVAGLGGLAVNPVLPMATQPAFPILAADLVAAIGQPVAAVLAKSADQGADAAELITVDYGETAQTTPPPVARKTWRKGAVDTLFDSAAQVVTATLNHPVLAPSPLEPRAIAVQYHTDTKGVTIWHSTQTPHRSRSALASILNIPQTRIRVIATDVGGAFGMKGSIYPEEVFAVWAALHHRRNIRWSATRSEEFLSASHGRGLSGRGRLALDGDGNFLALEAQIDAPLGHWLPNSALIPAWNAARVLPTGYDIAAVDITTTARLTNRPAMGIYRGAGRPEANALMENLVERAARASGLDPVALRLRNLVQPAQMPHTTATGNRLDSGDYGGALDLLCTKGGHGSAIARRDQLRAQGELAGVGIAFYLEPSGEGWESARVVLQDGHAIIASGSSAQGQSRATGYARIAAAALDLPMAAITVRFGDTQTCPEGIGALASRSTPIGGSAVLKVCRLARARREAGETGEITVETKYHNDGQAWGYGAFMACLRVDAETGAITLDRLVCADDTGTMIDPQLVRDQIIGGTAQGLGEALMERVLFDGDGQLLTGSLMDYALPRAADMPPLEIYSTQTPSPFNLLGAKGVGEAGTIGAPAAILNAALDALHPVGVRDLSMPLTPCRVWQAIKDAKQETRI